MEVEQGRNGQMEYAYDSYKKQLHNVLVLACSSASNNNTNNSNTNTSNKNKKSKTNKKNTPTKEQLYHVELKDTILFAEGGGQPTDHGYLVVRSTNEAQNANISSNSTDTAAVEKIKVSSVFRAANGRVVHITNKELTVGSIVSVELDWNRRFDHMQQHSGQHLMCAIAETFKSDKNNMTWETSSWWLGTDMCNVEFALNGSTITDDEITDTLQQIETKTNEAIRAHQPIEATIKPNEDDNEKGHHGALRIVKIGAYDDSPGNPCCGTHVSNTAQLQILMLGKWERVRNSKALRVDFIVGNRALALLHKQSLLCASVSSLFSSSADQAPTLITQMQKENRALKKDRKLLLEELAIAEAASILQEATVDTATNKVIGRHKPFGDMSFLRAIANMVKAKDEDIVCLLSCSPNKPLPTASSPKIDGSFLIATGSKARGKQIASMSKEIAKKVDGKGGGREGTYQGKCMDVASFHLPIATTDDNADSMSVLAMLREALEKL